MKKKLLALLLASVMILSLAACGGGKKSEETSSAGGDTAAAEESSGSTLHLGCDPETGEEFYGPYYDEWSDMTDEELYEQALKEDTAINVYATSSKMLKAEEPFEEMYPGLDLIVSDLDSDEVLSKAQIEHETGNVTADVLQTKDVSGSVFYEWYNQGILEPFYPRDICAHIDEGNLKYSYPLYASQAFWYYNTEAFPDGQPIDSWWQIIEKDENGKQRFRLFTKEIGQESAYLSLFASLLAVHNSTKDDPALCLASAGKIENQEESGYNIAWCINLKPYNALLNTESLFVAAGTNSPAGARLFIRYLTGGSDGESGGLKPFTKVGNWPLRDDVEDKKNPAKLEDLGARPNDIDAIYAIYPDVQDMWTYWLNKSPNK